MKVELPLRLYLIVGSIVVPFLAWIVFRAAQESLYLAVCFGFILVIAFSGYLIPATTSFSERSIKQFTFKGWREENWENISKVHCDRFGLHLETEGIKFIIMTSLYSNGDEVSSFLKTKLSGAEWVEQ